MKLSGVIAFALGAGIAQVAAQPIRLIIVSSSIQGSQLEGAGLGHGFEQPPAVATIVKTRPGPNPMYKTMMGNGGAKMRRPCGGRGRLNRFRQKGIEISNAFRQALGWPLIESTDKFKAAHHGPALMIHPAPPAEDTPHHPPPQHHGHKHHHHEHHHHHHKHHGKHGEAFVTRLNYSLMNLGTWEGIAVAFVLGCGIGVLLRMFFVLAVVAYRSVKGQREEEHEYSQVVTIEPFEDAAHLPPYPADEKIKVTTVEAPTEASK
ncbi:hypothetical protein M413DRAFT_442256 [Hebeloma cylindrosporum]|uniref:Copper transporter n=1 Tax=Hebeloma cylindrosporum TaxID=76867 RepID=A0A0C3C9Y2_HEBCY|nr:hypothetical protein M413DRAFT_442256 [Hebeloma cylindrosporum h7]